MSNGSFNETDIGAPQVEDIVWLELFPDHF